MPTLKEQLESAVGETGKSIGELAGALQERMFAANAAGDTEKAREADSLFQDYTFFAMKLGRLRIAAIDDSAEMKSAIAALKAANKGLMDETSRVADLRQKIDGTASLLGKVEDGIDKVAKLIPERTGETT